MPRSYVDPDDRWAAPKELPLFTYQEARMIVDKMDHLARGTLDVSPETLELVDALSKVIGLNERRQFNGLFLKKHRVAKDSERPPISGSSPFYCPRRMAYKLMGEAEEDPAPRVLMAWYMGRCIEAMTVRLIALTNPSMTWPRIENGELVEKKVTWNHPTYGEVHGHVDAVIRYEGQEVPVEVKSHADFGYRRVQKASEVPNTFGHKSQLNFYCAAMGVERGFYIAVNKSTGHRTEIEHRFDRGLFNADMSNLAEAHGMVQMKMLPERPSWALTKQTLIQEPDTYQETIASVVCQYCPFTEVCWPDFARVTNEKGKPEWRKVLA